ncbi:MAG: triose-phosphate isomerase [Pelolinea sp.]|jgi:triosephosphate isomerase|nr:triose-phosphate isomerase [Pelolinea sp.]
MRKPFVAGNWKMNKTVEQASLLVADLLPGLQAIQKIERVLCPPFPSLMVISQMIAGTDIGLGAQNMHWEESGAFTGEVAPAMVKEFCDYVIVGHSERRQFFAETDQTVNAKVKAALKMGLTPIVCVGETITENEAGRTAEIVQREVLEGLKDLSSEDAVKLVIAYEPIWAIGTGKAATSQQAEDIIGKIVRGSLADRFGSESAEQIRILYGGSVKGSNAAEFFGMPDIDGALVGGASLKADEFIQICQAAQGSIK